ncbi:MAG: polysaccharide deacetylase family protein [Victivallales bacterium]|nr:polysaccharide deacetylase family protein [Victivallales bacterium]
MIDFSKIAHGAVCLTFDDGRHQQWLPNLPLFRRYHAHATFFYSAELDESAISSMMVLRQEGHSVGLHTVNHCDASPNLTPQTKEEYFRREIAPQIAAMSNAGLSADYFAYPNNRRDDYTESVMAQYFRHCRAGVRPSPPKGSWIADCDPAFLPLEQVAGALTLGGIGIGDYYLSTTENLDGALERTARENRLLTFYSHGISPDAQSVNIKTGMLEHILAKCAELGIAMLSFDELP